MMDVAAGGANCFKQSLVELVDIRLSGLSGWQLVASTLWHWPSCEWWCVAVRWAGTCRRTSELSVVACLFVSIRCVIGWTGRQVAAAAGLAAVAQYGDVKLTSRVSCCWHRCHWAK